MEYRLNTSTENLGSLFTELRAALAEKLAGHSHLIDRLLVATITGGHVLIEGAPGLAKTRTVNAFSALMDTSFVRVQATPDLLPADLTGTNVYEQATAKFTFIEGPLFNNIVLFDEINRAPPKVQSALLEAMGESQVSVGGVTRQLAEPFLVVATQNPIEHEGTYPLPEAQLDRFMFFVSVELPAADQEKAILDLVLNETQMLLGSGENANATMGSNLPLISAQQISAVRTLVANVHVSEAVRHLIVRLVMATRKNLLQDTEAATAAMDIEHAASPRGSIFLAKSAQAQAWLAGRDHVLPEDVIALATDVLSGRIVLSYQAQAQGKKNRAVVQQIVDTIAVV